ncbi:hypothetical protein OV450_5944 [Actinobacteria bacterium OV450]|nr:hypothetical protein OV450_5944 [Actinobacteria bacterium OV450]
MRSADSRVGAAQAPRSRVTVRIFSGAHLTS